MSFWSWLFPLPPEPIALTADAQILQGPKLEPQDDRSMRRNLQRTSEEWQREVWDFYDNLGEFRQGVQWKSNMLSRVRLVAAKRAPGNEDPEIVTTGPAADLIAELAGGIGGQARLMSDFSTYFDVPGECYLIGETMSNGINKWYTRSMEEVRRTVGSDTYEVTDVTKMTKWRKLPEDSMVVRVWRPHRRWHNVADSPARSGRTLMRELELVNRHIQSQYLSRLASAGIIVFPDEITFPVRPEFADEPDPFVAEWIAIAAEAIRTPGTAAAVVPIPLKVPGEYIEKIKHIDFTLKLDDKIIEKRDSGLKRLAITLDMPAEALLGTANTNHWSAWLVDEQGIKTHVAPVVELICDALTTGYLTPRLAAQDVADADELIVWYDASNLILRPDRSEGAAEVYDRLELTGEALRREHGFDESDAPSEDELRSIILKKAALQPVNTFAAMDELGLKTEHDTPPAEERPPEEAPPEQDKRVEPGPPDKPPVRPEKAADELRQTLIHQAGLEHAMRIDMHGVELLHPKDCAEHLFSCPVTHATWDPLVKARPGSSGIYRCWLNDSGQPIIGDRVFTTAAINMIETSLPVRSNGVAH